MTDIENQPEQRALEKAPFTRDGVLRRSGAWHGILVYSKLQSDRYLLSSHVFLKIG